MAYDLLEEKGVPLDRQRFTWRELAAPPISKLDDDAFTRVRVLLMSGVEAEAVAFSHACGRKHAKARLPLAEIRRVEHHQQTLVSWLLGPDHSPLETTIALEQAAIEVSAHLARTEPDPYLAQVYRFGLLEDFDHLYAYAALLDRLEGKDANDITQCYTDLRPGRPTAVQHRAPADDLRTPYDRRMARPLSRLDALTLVAGEQQARSYYVTIGPTFADPIARMLYAEIASVEEQHVTQYESIIDPGETWIEKWLLHEATEVWNYWSCARSESNPRVKAIWERFLDYEQGHLRVAMRHFSDVERRDPAEVLPETLPEPITFQSHRQFVRDVVADELELRAAGPTFIRAEAGEPERTLAYRNQMNADGSPSEMVAAGYIWRPGTELIERAIALVEERSVH